MRTTSTASRLMVVLVGVALLWSATGLTGCYYQTPVYEAEAYEAQASGAPTYEAQPAQPEPAPPVAAEPAQPADIASPFNDATAAATVSAPPPLASASVEPPPAATAAPAPQPVEGTQADVVTIPVAARPEFYALLGQAQSLMSAGQYPQALRVLNAARRFNRHPAVLFNMAICLEHMRDFQRAAALYRRASVDPVLGPRATERINVLVGSQMIMVR